MTDKAPTPPATEQPHAAAFANDGDATFTPWMLWRLMRAEPTAYHEAATCPASAIYALALTLLTGGGLFLASHGSLTDFVLGAMTAAGVLLAFSLPFALAGYIFGAPPRAYAGFVIVLASSAPVWWPSLMPWGQWLSPETGALVTLVMGGFAILATSRLIFQSARYQMRLHDAGAAMIVLLPVVTIGLFVGMFAHTLLPAAELSAIEHRLLGWSWSGTAFIALATYLWFAALWFFYPGWSFSRGTVVWKRGGVKVLDRSRRERSPLDTARRAKAASADCDDD